MAIERLAAALAGHIPVATGGARPFARSARSKEEVAGRPTVPLAFAGTLFPAAASAGMVRFAEPTGVGAGAGAAKRGRPDEAVGAGAPLARAAPASSSNAELKKTILQINARVERRNKTIKALNDELKSTQRELNCKDGRVRGLERELVTATEEAAVAAYEDSAQRVRDVKEAWYMRTPTSARPSTFSSAACASSCARRDSACSAFASASATCFATESTAGTVDVRARRRGPRAVEWLCTKTPNLTIIIGVHYVFIPRQHILYRARVLGEVAQPRLVPPSVGAIATRGQAEKGDSQE